MLQEVSWLIKVCYCCGIYLIAVIVILIIYSFYLFKLIVSRNNHEVQVVVVFNLCFSEGPGGNSLSSFNHVKYIMEVDYIYITFTPSVSGFSFRHVSYHLVKLLKRFLRHYIHYIENLLTEDIIHF